MNILLSNDDGYTAPGLIALHQALLTLGHTIMVVAPEHNNSAKSNSLTLHSPLYVHQGANGFQYVNGTPADCVHIALTGLLDTKPDLVVSGINNGANMGDDTIYSGTVGAAMEGYLFGIPAVAFSQVDKGWAHIDDAAKKAADFVAKLIATELQPSPQDAVHWPWLLNVNIPNLPYGDIGPIEVTRLGRRHAAQPVIAQPSPRGETMYWIGAVGLARDAEQGTDFHATARGCVAVTPLHVDLTNHKAVPKWHSSLS